MDTRGQRRPRRAVSSAQPSTNPEVSGTEAHSAKKEGMDKSSATAKKRRTPPGVSDDESRQEKKVKTENEPSRRQRTLTRAARGRAHATLDDEATSGTASKVTAEVPSDNAAPTSDEEKVVAKSTNNDHSKSAVSSSRARRAAASKAKQEKDVGVVEPETRPSRRRVNGSQSVETKAAASRPIGSHMRGNEVEFGQHWRNSKGLSFDSATKVLMMTLKSAKHIDLAEENMQICADCRGGGDLLCCDCCPLAFHADCLEPLERPASLYVPIPKHGLKTKPAQESGNDQDGGDKADQHPQNHHTDETSGANALTSAIISANSAEEQFRLRDSEWFCPYCLSHPILKLWKRGVPCLLSLFEGFDCTEQEDYKEARPRKMTHQVDSAVKKEAPIDADMTEDEDADTESHREASEPKANVVEWMSEVERFVSQPHSVDALFPPSILLALSGIRRAIQRHGALYSAVSKNELDKLNEKESLKASVANATDVLPLAATDEAAEPSVVVKNDVVIKAPIMGRRSSSAQIKSDDEQGSATIKTEAPPRRSTRRAQALAERRAVAAARNAAKPIVREKEHPPEYDDGPVVQAKINVGASFQVPGVNRHFLEAREFGLDYLIFDKRSVCAYLPMDHLGRVPTAKLHLGSGCRLVYSATELRKRQERVFKLKKANGAPLAALPQVPLTDDELSEFTRQVIALWPVWIQWPPTQEFALKLLHHCRYDAKAALRLLCSDALQFRAICDPPVKPYMNKWRPRDRRGHLPSIPFPPPSNAVALMGVGRSQSAGNKTDNDC